MMMYENPQFLPINSKFPPTSQSLCKLKPNRQKRNQRRKSSRKRKKNQRNPEPQMVSDALLVQRLREFLRTSDLTTTTTGTVRRQLESDFNVDLSEKKAFIREQVDLFLSELANEKKEEEPEEEEEEEEENEVKEEEEEEEEEEEGEEEEESNGGSSRKRGSNKHNKEVKKRSGGFNKVCSLSPLLQEFIGEAELARTEVVKRIWAYIRENSLQDPSNRRKILCDERMQNLFSVKSIDMFQMNKALSKHIWPLDSEGPAKPAQKEKKPKKEREASDESPRKVKKQKVGKGFLAPLQLSDALAKFIGTGENELPRSDVVKRMWNYIKQNNLQDPTDKRTILCDEKLKELFQVDSFTGFTVPKLLAAHFIKTK